MNILSIGSDKKLFEEHSSVRVRVTEYGRLVDNLLVIVFSKKSDHLSRAEIKEGSNVTLIPTQSVSRWLYPLDAVLAGNKLLRERVATGESMSTWVITAQDPFESGFAAWALSRLFGAPFQLQIHTDFFALTFRNASTLNKVRSVLAGFLIPKATRIRVVSESLKDRVVSRFRIDPDCVDVLPVYVDVESFSAQALSGSVRERFPQATHILLSVGRLAPEKNVSLALRAFKTFHAYHPDSVFLIVGDGPLLSQLQRDAENLGVSGSVIFEGWQNTLAPYYAAADIFLLTSDFEGYGMVLIEAAASKVALVSTDVGVASEFFGQQGAGRVCPVGDAECLSKALLQVSENTNSRVAMAQRAYDIVIKKYGENLSEYAKKQAGLWSKMLEKG